MAGPWPATTNCDLATPGLAAHIGLVTFASAAFWRHTYDESTLRRRFWRKVGVVVRTLPFTEDLLAAYYCAFDRATPRRVQLMLMAAIAYFVLPADAVPDWFPVIGFTDDAAVLAATVKLVADHITGVHRQAARAALARISGA